LIIARHDESLVLLVKKFADPKLEKTLYAPGQSKSEFYEGLGQIKNELNEYIKKEFNENPELPKKLKESDVIFEEEINRIVHKNIVDPPAGGEKRPDGRKIDELRELSAEVGVIPHTHGSGLFNRGTTQALSILTLASPGAEQWIETMEIELTKKRFMHHYVFPPFSVGEVGRMGFTGRREIGHGALAERALEPIIPSKDDFPYTIRVVSEILSSNGSSSMASVCGSSLALMDGGVPVKTPAAGIAMGLMFSAKSSQSEHLGGSATMLAEQALGGDDRNEKLEYKVLTDIQGPEDHHGDMDLKVAGTKDGITAMQMDVKVEGINIEILEAAFKQAKKARLEILEAMAKAITTHRADLAPTAPRVKIIKINPEKIGALIGPQGKVINGIIERTGVQIDIDDDGSVFITSDSAEGMKSALRMVNEVTYEAKPGDEFDGIVSRLLDFGAMIEYLPGKEGLVHVSEISHQQIRRPSDVLKLGQHVHVRVKNIDDYGRINLSMK